MITRPMLAADLYGDDHQIHLSWVQYPTIATPKLDGFRCPKMHGKALTRSFKEIPNEYVRKLIQDNIPDGFDGEVVTFTDGSYRTRNDFDTTSSLLRKHKGIPYFMYITFDFCLDPTRPYVKRITDMAHMASELSHLSWFHALEPKFILNEEQLMEYESQCLLAGFEGICFRTPLSPYKSNRSTVREGYLIKLKRFVDGEAEIIGFSELLHNDNWLTINELGFKHRPTIKAYLNPGGTLGSLKVRDLKNDFIFNIGIGFNDLQRKTIWENKEKYKGQIVKFMHQPGHEYAPAKFVGIRPKEDMEEPK